MIASPRVGIVIVNWNGTVDTLACLESLRHDTYEPKFCVVVDNGSISSPATLIQNSYSDIDVIEAGENLGFTGGNKIGINWALKQSADYVLLLNNDTVLGENAIATMVNAAATSGAALITPLIRYFSDPQDVWFGGSSLDASRAIAVHENSTPPSPTDPLREVPWASGCAMLISSSIMHRLGGFDDRFFLNWEDVDLCIRIRNMGGRIFLVPSATVFHKVGGSFAAVPGAAIYYYYRNRFLLLRIHGQSRFYRSYFQLLIDTLRALARGVIRGNVRTFAHARPFLRAIGDDWMGRFGQGRNI